MDEVAEDGMTNTINGTSETLAKQTQLEGAKVPLTRRIRPIVPSVFKSQAN